MAVDFTSSQDCTFGSNWLAAGQDVFSVGMWVNPDTVTGTHVYYHQRNDVEHLTEAGSATALRFQCKAVTSSWQVITSSVTVSTGEWIFVGNYWSKGETDGLKIFVDTTKDQKNAVWFCC